MPDKHEVGGSTPLEPTSRQCRQPVIGEVQTKLKRITRWESRENENLEESSRQKMSTKKNVH